MTEAIVSPGSVLEHVRGLYEEVVRQLESAREEGDRTGVLRCVDRALKSLELMARLAGELKTESAIEVNVNLTIQTLIDHHVSRGMTVREIEEGLELMACTRQLSDTELLVQARQVVAMLEAKNGR